jgi:RNase adaptor protein for sRNA GlmZ degradation
MSQESKSTHISIYTWGNKKRKFKPSQSQHNFCVTGISCYKPHGINLKTTNGTDRRIQEKLQRQPKFSMYMKSALSKIQTDELHTISINCHKGRHRSVGFAELLKVELIKLGYVVDVYHLEL